MLAIMCGSVIYRIIIALILRMGLDTNDMKLFTAIVVALALSILLCLRTSLYLTERRPKDNVKIEWNIQDLNHNTVNEKRVINNLTLDLKKEILLQLSEEMVLESPLYLIL